MDTPFTTTKEISLLSNQSAAPAARSTNFWSAPLAVATDGVVAPDGPPRLTLSAYCRPENAVRLTDADPARVIRSEYELLDPRRCRTLGHGASSTVRLAYRRSDGRPVAVKTIAKHDALGLWSKTNRWRAEAMDSLSSPRDGAGEMRRGARRAPRLDEADVLTSLRGACPNVVQLIDVYETHQEVQLVLEYCEGGDLFDCIKRRKQFEFEQEQPTYGLEPTVIGSFSEMETAKVAKTMLDVLQILHSRNIVHRDIKPENILLVDEDDCTGQLAGVKLTDFGLARLLHDDIEASSLHGAYSDDECLSKQRSRAYSRVGSDYYAAPEVHLGSGYDTPVDVFSLGVTLYVMLCGTPPSSMSQFKVEDTYFSDEDSSCMASVSEESTQSSHGSKSGLFPAEPKITPLAQDLILKMIHPDPEKRIDASEALKHEWIVKYSVEEESPKIAHAASKLSLSSSSGSIRPRALSFAESESILRIGPVIPVGPPGNSPTLSITMAEHVGQRLDCDTPTSTAPSPSVAVSLTLADVCNKLAPLVDEQQLHRQRKHRRCSHSRCDGVCPLLSRKHPRNQGDEQPRKKRSAITKKKVYLEMSHHPRLSPNKSFANNRIGRRFNTPLPIIGPLLPQHYPS